LKQDPILTFIVIVIGAFLAITVVVFAGIFIGIPVALIFIAYFFFRWASKPTELSVQELYERTPSSFPTDERFLDAFLDRVIEDGNVPVWPITSEIAEIVGKLYSGEGLEKEPLPVYAKGSVEEARFKDRLLAYRRKAANSEETIQTIADTLFDAYSALRNHLPPLARDERYVLSDGPKPPLTVPLVEAIPDIGSTVRDLSASFQSSRVQELGLFTALRQTLVDNYLATAGRSSEPIPPDRCKSRARDLVHAYLKDTPFEEIFDAPVPFEVPLSKQLEHSMIAAGSRYGKSQLIGSIIATHLQSENPPGIIVVDSTGDFVEKISRLALFAPTQRLEGKLLVIDPADAPQLNMFDISAVRARGYSQSDLEQVEADIINMFNYVFASIGSELTAQQGTGFNFLVRLLLSIPGSTISTLREILELPAKTYNDVPTNIKQAIDKLDLTTQAYFRNQFFTLTMLPTRQGVARRLYGILQIPTFERMFSGGNRIDFFQAMQDGKIIVVNTAKSVLQPSASALFGRYIIARVMSGAFERTVIKEMNKRQACVLFIDEAQEYFDGTIDTLLTQIGKFRLGICLAFQYFGQMDDKLRASILGNTTVKYAGGLNVSESRMIARELRVDDEFVMAQRKDSDDPPQWAQFATHIKYSTDHAVSLRVPFYALENMPKMSDAAYRTVMEANRSSVAAPLALPPRTTSPPQSVTLDDHPTAATSWD
jgi:hypothetical protein